MNIDRVTTTTMFVFSLFLFSIRSSPNNSNQLPSPSIHIFEFCCRHTHAHFFLLSLIFFLPSLQPLYTLLLLVCVELAMCECICMCTCVCVMMAEKNLCMIAYIYIVLPLIRPILAYIPVFFIEMVNFVPIETYLLIR
jgi:hypothetical protein